MELNKIYNENCLDTMEKMPDNFVDLVVTSPPYDNMRTYNGYNFEFEKIAKELYRVIKWGGVVVWIVNDATIGGSETGTSFRQALFFKDCGFNLHDTMIWCKDGGGAVGSHSTYNQNFEYMFVFSKGKPKAVNLITDKLNKTAGTMKKTGRRVADGSKKQEDSYRCPEKTKRNNWWLIVPNKEEGSEFHPAVFPEQLAAGHIITWSNEGDIVYDPFAGSGTTAKMSVVYNRQYIGSEISKEYAEKAIRRIKNEEIQMKLF